MSYPAEHFKDSIKKKNSNTICPVVVVVPETYF